MADVQSMSFLTSRICLMKCRINGSGSPRNWFCFNSSYRLMFNSSNTKHRWFLNWKQSSNRTMFLVSLGSYFSFSCQRLVRFQKGRGQGGKGWCTHRAGVFTVIVYFNPHPNPYPTFLVAAGT